MKEIAAPATGQLAPKADLEELVRDFLSSSSELTRRAYSRDLQAFAESCSAATPEAAMRRLVNVGQGAANLAALRWKNTMTQAGLAPATINRRLAALRSAFAFFRQAGVISWSLDVKPSKAEKRRNTAGPGVDAPVRMLKAIRGDGIKALRDRAIMRLLYSLMLRRSSVTCLDVDDVNLEASTIRVRLKGRGHEKAQKTLPPHAREAIAAYLKARGNPTSGPLFLNVDRARKGDGRMSGTGVYFLVRDLGKAAGVKARPHGLRHQGATDLAQRSGGNAAMLRAAGDWKDLRTPARYLDRTEEFQREAAALLDVAAGA